MADVIKIIAAAVGFWTVGRWMGGHLARWLDRSLDRSLGLDMLPPLPPPPADDDDDGLGYFVLGTVTLPVVEVRLANREVRFIADGAVPEVPEGATGDRVEWALYGTDHQLIDTGVTGWKWTGGVRDLPDGGRLRIEVPIGLQSSTRDESSFE